MSVSAAITTIVILDVALIAFVAWMMSHPRHLTPHVSQRDRVALKAQRFFEQDPMFAEDRQPEGILQRVD